MSVLLFKLSFSLGSELLIFLDMLVELMQINLNKPMQIILMSIGIVFALLSMITYGTSELFAKRCMNNLNPASFAVYRLLFSSLFLLPVFIFVPFVIPRFTEVLILAGIGLLGAIPYFFYLKAIQKGEVSIASPVSKSAALFTVILSAIFFQEKLPYYKYGAMIVLITAVFFISFNVNEIRKLRIHRLFEGLEFALLAAIGWGVVYFLIKFNVNIIGPYYAAFFLEFFVFIFTCLGVKLFANKNESKNSNNIIEFNRIPAKIKWFIIIGAGCVSLGTLFYSLAISHELVSIAVMITKSTPIITVLGGQLLLKERLSIQQNISAVMIIAGILLITL